MPVYLDCNATTPIEPEVADVVVYYLREEFGNAGSRTHEYGIRAKRAVQEARRQVAEVVGARPEEVVFTSGATESNNLSLLGLERFGRESGRMHVVTTQIEHKAVLEPIEQLEARGFEVTRVAPTPGGWVQANDILSAVRPETLLVSVMHVNNETGVIQPIEEIASGLRRSETYFHVDAAQGFGKRLEDLRNDRIDLVSASAHKVYGPKGIGALVTRRRRFKTPPLTPLMWGGGQERALRPGTLPVHLVAGFGAGCAIALRDISVREARNAEFKEQALKSLNAVDVSINGDQSRAISSTLNLSIAGLDSEAALLASRDLVSISNGSACTSQSYSPSHVLEAMGLEPEQADGAVRLSWCHLTPSFDWGAICDRFKRALT